MSKETLERLLQDISNTWIHPQGLHLAGGEAFLNFELLLFGVEKCRKLNLSIEYVETNAGWCLNFEIGLEKFRLLKEAGLKNILISVSPFHAETIPLKRTLAAIEAAKEVFGPENVIIYMEQFLPILARFGKEKPIPLGKWLEEFGAQKAGKIFWDGYALIPGGRAGVELGFLAPRKYPAQAFAGENCAREILLSRHAHFDPYGNYIPLFCGGLSLGKFEDLPSFVKTFDYRRLPLVKILVEEGPFGLAQFASHHFGHSFDGLFAGKCHLCVEVRNFLQKKDVFPELSPKEFYSNLRSHLPSLKNAS